MLTIFCIYLVMALFLSASAAVMVHYDHAPGEISGTRSIVVWAWGWPILLLITLISGWIKLIPTEYFRRHRKEP